MVLSLWLNILTRWQISLMKWEIIRHRSDNLLVYGRYNLNTWGKRNKSQQRIKKELNFIIMKTGLMFSGSLVFQYHRFCDPEDGRLRFSEHFRGTNLNRVGGSVFSNTELDVFAPLLFPFFQLKINPAILNNTAVTASYQRRPRQHATAKRCSADLLPLFPGSEDGILLLFASL